MQVVEEAMKQKDNKSLSCYNPATTEELQFSSGHSFQKQIIALLPGSRKQEITIKLPIMLEASKQYPDYQFIIAQAPGQSLEFYKEMVAPYPTILIALAGETYSLLMQSKAALVTSGTATLETALFGVPQVVCYKGSNISYQIGKRLVKIKYISLVNLIMDKPVVKELIQNELTVKNIITGLHDILYNEQRLNQVKADYAALKYLLQQGVMLLPVPQKKL